MSNSDLKVTWSLKKADRGLEVHYSLENLSAGVLHVLDQTVAPQGGRYVIVDDRSVVQRGAKPNLVKFSRGYVSAASQMPQIEQGENHPIFPAARPLPPGGRLDGVFHVPLPIAPWHPNLQMAPIKDPQRAVLEIGYLAGAPSWAELPTDGGAIRVPARPWAVKQQWAQGEEKPLP